MGNQGHCTLFPPKTLKKLKKQARGAAEGGASVQMYVNALYRGCRCLEMDLWNGSANLGNEPVISNGDPKSIISSLASDKIILFLDVVKAVKALVNRFTLVS